MSALQRLALPRGGDWCRLWLLEWSFVPSGLVSWAALAHLHAQPNSKQGGGSTICFSHPINSLSCCTSWPHKHLVKQSVVVTWSWKWVAEGLEGQELPKAIKITPNLSPNMKPHNLLRNLPHHTTLNFQEQFYSLNYRPEANRKRRQMVELWYPMPNQLSSQAHR